MAERAHDMPEEKGKRQSLRALDSTNFFLADVETGAGPFVSTFLGAQGHWSSAQIGLITGSQNLAAVLAQAPAGWLIDESRHKRWLVAVGALLLSLGSLAVVFTHTLPMQVLNQAVIGIALAVILPSVSAISLGIVGRERLGPRIGRNAMFIHIGNALTAGVAGWLASRNGQEWIFYASAALGLLAFASALLIRPSDINDETARARDEGGGEVLPAGQVLRRPTILLFVLIVVLYHVSNASMLPLAGQELAHRVGKHAGAYMSACIVVAQMVMVPVAALCGRLANRIGRKPLFVAGFLALIARGLLYAFVTEPLGIVAIEAIDGISTATAGITAVLVIADLAQGTGRFNLLQGAAQAALGVGAFAGKVGSGWLADTAGFRTAFLALSCVAFVSLLVLLLLMPETRSTGASGMQGSNA